MAIRLSDVSDDLPVNHEINVTPFIDVMLVLLIIFMVAAPLSTVDVPVNLPQSGVPPAERPEEPLIVTLKQDLTLNLGNAPIPRETLAAQLMTAAGGKPETRIYLRADKAVPYGELMTVMSLLREGGFHQVALMAEQTLP
jgi:biopolymer transport protein ExbD